MPPSDPIRDMLVAQARDGDEAALGRLLELYGNFLRLLARSLIRPPLQVRLDASELVQETFVKAHREFAPLAGSGERELVAWLRQILVRKPANQAKHHHARRRDQRRHESLHVLLDRSSLASQEQLAVSIASPSAHAVRREQAALLADALACLPVDYRELFINRNLEQILVDEVAARMVRFPRRSTKSLGPGHGRAQASDGGLFMTPNRSSPLDRRPPDAEDDSKVVRRFVEEAQIGGELQYPGVVPVYEMGTFPDRRLFFGMKLIKGRNLAALLAERRDRAGRGPPDCLDTRAQRDVQVQPGEAHRNDQGTRRASRSRELHSTDSTDVSRGDR